MTEVTKIKALVVGAPLLHNGTRYGIGDTVELTEAEYASLSVYLEKSDDALTAQKQAETEAQELAEALKAQAEAEALKAQAEAEALKAQAEAEAVPVETEAKPKGKKGK